jgi:hypothetical protein
MTGLLSNFRPGIPVLSGLAFGASTELLRNVFLSQTALIQAHNFSCITTAESWTPAGWGV